MAELRDNSLILGEGEHIRFPVDDGDPLADCQGRRRIGSLDDIGDFQFVQEWSAGAPFGGGNRPSAELLLRYVMERSGGTIMTLQLADFVVPAGASVLLTGPLVEINANNVVIGGQLKFTDDLVIRCNEIRGA